MLDASKIRIIKNLLTKARQPWMKWVERKLNRVKNKWGVKGSIFGVNPKRKEKNELNNKCLVESSLKIWFEIKGSEKDGVAGLVVDKNWTPLGQITSRQLYNILV